MLNIIKKGEMMKNIVIQHDEKDCGPACLCMIAKNFGIKIPLIKCREILRTDNNGTSLYAMIEGAKKIGLDATAYRCTVKEIEEAVNNKEVHLPIVAHIVSDSGYLHYVVVYGIRKTSVVIGDPAKGLVKIKKCQFYKKWTGIMIDYKKSIDYQYDKVDYVAKNAIQSILKKEKINIFFIGLISLSISIIGLANIFLVQYFIDYVNNIVNGGRNEHQHILVENEGGTSWIVSFVVEVEHFMSDYYNIVILVVIVYLLQFVFKILRGKKLSSFVQKFDIQLVMETYRKAIGLPLGYYECRRTGEIISRFADTSKIRETTTKILMTLLNDSVIVSLFGLTLFFINKQIFLGIICIIFIYVTFIFLEKKPLKKINNEILKNNEGVISYITNTFSSISTIKLFKKQNFEIKMKRIFTQLTQSVKKGMLLHTAIEGLSSLIFSIGTIAILLMTANQCIMGNMSIGTMISCYMIVGLMLNPIKNIVGLQEDIQTATVAIERLNDILMAEIEKERENILKNVKFKSLKIKEISFSYGYRDEVLSNVSLDLFKGEKVAVIGKTGCGKSTLAKLLVNFYNCDDGAIFYNGLDIKEINLELLREKISYLSQSVDIFNDTIKNNIIMDRDDITEDMFQKACKVALVDEIVENLPQKYETVIDEKGYDLSQGEKQRIALARAIVGNPEVIILDEMTSNLDYLTEERILNNINVFIKEKTILYIAHRLSTIKKCEKIIVMDAGKIIEMGSHDELVKTNGKYMEMLQTQTV